MAKADREYQLRMEGYVSAYAFIQKNGVDALAEDIRARGFYKIPITVSQEEFNNFKEFVMQNMYNTMLTVACMTLHDIFGFGKKRLKRFKDGYDKTTETTVDFDYAGQHYVTMEDYAVYLNERADLGFDVSRIAAIEDQSRFRKQNKDKTDIKVIIQKLKDAGFEDAAEWLEKKVS